MAWLSPVEAASVEGAGTERVTDAHAQNNRFVDPPLEICFRKAPCYRLPQGVRRSSHAAGVRNFRPLIRFVRIPFYKAPD